MPNNQPDANQSDAGFTLIETLVVLVVLGLMVSVLLARGPVRSVTLDLTAASRTLTAELRHARGQAIATDRPVRIGLSEVREALGRAARRDRAGAIGLALHSPADDPHGNGTLRFDPDGSASGGRIVLTEGQEQVSIRIDWLTGRIVQGTIGHHDGV